LTGRVPASQAPSDGVLSVQWNGETAGSAVLSAASFALAVVLKPALEAWSTLTIEATGNGLPLPFDLELTDISLDSFLPRSSEVR
jgi:hypothetical protein